MKNKLTAPDKETYKKDSNELSEDMAILECRSGKFAGSTRLIVRMIDTSKNQPLRPESKFLVLLYGSFGEYRYVLDTGTNVTYDYDLGMFSFSSNKTRYIIRAVQDTDKIIGGPD